ncbi:hypothetical protein [Pseudonocardia spinosispora]|uniref:hypothetical protein n=1 Tax=Pseudonocardia spinosispora TaxID=103441 RepID=UPI000419CF3E|nr:hypothetical protein [Pseudonocardia spinosispora]
MRLFGTVVVTAAVTQLPVTTEKATTALANGLISERDAMNVGYDELPVSLDRSAPELAVRAGEQALCAAGLPAEDLGLLVHAWTYYQGHDFWSPAHYVADQLGARRAQPVGLQQMCNGGAAAIEVVAARLLADPGMTAGLVTTADCFGPPGFDRWRGDYNLWYGDGATGAVMRRGTADTPGLALWSMATTAVPHMEAMHRDLAAFHRVAMQAGDPVDVRRTKKAYLSVRGKAAFVAELRAAVHAVLSTALAEADLAPDDARLRCVVVPRLGAAAVDTIYGPAVRDTVRAPVLDLGRATGHLGAGDMVANLADIGAGATIVEPGELAVVLSAGAGFTWSATVVERRSTRDPAQLSATRTSHRTIDEK